MNVEPNGDTQTYSYVCMYVIMYTWKKLEWRASKSLHVLIKFMCDSVTHITQGVQKVTYFKCKSTTNIFRRRNLIQISQLIVTRKQYLHAMASNTNKN